VDLVVVVAVQLQAAVLLVNKLVIFSVVNNICIEL
jgi:hypothetical protein